MVCLCRLFLTWRTALSAKWSSCPWSRNTWGHCSSVSASRVRAKVSLGTNPWNQANANQNLASLAEKHGGGGHPRVSAISFDPGDLAHAREVARDLAAALRGE